MTALLSLAARGLRAALFLAGFAALLVLAVVYATSASINIDGKEQNVIFAAQRLLAGEALYNDPGRMPFVVTPYPPLYYWLHHAIAAIAGLRPDSLHGLYLSGRLLSVAASAGSCMVVYAILTGFTGLSVVTRLGLALLLPLSLNPWPFVSQPDALYLFLAAAGLWGGLRYAESGRTAPLLASMLALAAAFLTKQTGLLLFPVPFILAAVRGSGLRIRWTHMLLALAIAAAATGFVLLRRPMLQNFVAGLANGIDVRLGLGAVALPTLLHRVPLLLAVLLACGQAVAGGDRRALALGAVALWCLTFGVLLCLKWGSDLNVFAEFLLCCVLLHGLAPGLVSARGSAPRPFGLLLLALLLGQLAWSAYQARPGIWAARLPREDIYASGQLLAADPALRGQAVMVLDYTSLIFVPDRAAFAPFELLGTAAGSGSFDLEPVRQAIRQGKLCHAVTSAFLLPTLRHDLPPQYRQDEWIAVIGGALLADFHSVRRIGSKLLLTSDHCRPHG